MTRGLAQARLALALVCAGFVGANFVAYFYEGKASSLLVGLLCAGAAVDYFVANRRAAQ